MTLTQIRSNVFEKTSALRASFNARLLFFVLADVLLLLLLTTFPFIWGVFIEQDSMNQFLNTEGQITDIDQIPDETVVGVYWLFAKSIVIVLGYLLAFFALFVIGQSVAWSLYRKRKKLFSHWKQITLASIAWLFVACFPLFIILMILAPISLAFTGGGVGNIVVTVLMLVAWLLVLFVTHLTAVLLFGSTNGYSVGKTFALVWEKGILQFHTYIGWYILAVVLLIIVATILGLFMGINNVQFISVLLVFFFIGWMKSYVAVRLVKNM